MSAVLEAVAPTTVCPLCPATLELGALSLHLDLRHPAPAGSTR